MTNAPAAVAVASPQKKTAAKPKKVSSHPPTATMVTEAIKSLKDKKGSSLQAIKKFISATYKVDADKLAPFIRKYLVSATAAGKIISTKGKGAAGSFKLPVKAKEEKKKVAKPTSKPKAKPSKAKAAKPASKPKKAAAKPKKAKPAAKTSKAKTVTKPPTKKPKAPKPKKAAVKKSPKKAAPKKK